MAGIAGQTASRLFPALLAVVAAAPISAHAAEGTCLPVAEEGGAVAAVPDAHTIALADGRTLRLAGIEPMSLLGGGGESDLALRDRIAALTAGAPLAFVALGKAEDRHGRLPSLAAVDGEVLQTRLLREGLAVFFATGTALPCLEDMLAAESEARRERRGFWAGSAALPPPLPEALRDHVGHFAIFEGEVLSVGNRRDRTYLNFGGRWSEDVTVEIEARHRKSFGGEAALAALAGLRLRIRGFLQEKAGPMMTVTSPMQIERLTASSGGRSIAP